MPKGEKGANLRLRQFTSEYALGEEVYLRVRSGAVLGMITRVTFSAGRERYGVSWENDTRSTHDAFELTREFAREFDTEPQPEE